MSNVHESKQKWSCEVCKTNYSSKNSLRNHRSLLHNPTRDIDVNCDICGKQVRKTKLNRHKETHKNIKYDCDVCGKLLSSKETLSAHRKSHTSKDQTFECQVCQKILKTRTGLWLHKVSKHEDNPAKSFHCDQCSSVFKMKGSLNVHLKTVHDRIHCSCGICGKTFSHPRYLKNHKQQIHGDYQTFECDFCKKQFTYKPNLRKHVKIVHENVP